MEANVYQRHTKYRTCTKKSYEIHSERLYLMLQIKTIETKIVTTRLELQDIMYLVKCLKSPQNTIAQLVSFISSKTRAGQTGRKLYVTRGKTNYTRHFYLNRIAKLWNSLPADNYIGLFSICLQYKTKSTAIFNI